MMYSYAKLFFVAGLILGLGACSEATDPLGQEMRDLGSFELKHNIVIADNAKFVPPSRKATPEEWEAVLSSEIERRFGAYEGGRDYHIALHVDGYALAVPGIPLVLAPKSILVVSANIWDDRLGRKLHEEPMQMTVFEGGAGALVGTGFTRSKEEQMVALSRNMAKRIQDWMLENPQWFDQPPTRAQRVNAVDM